MVVLGVFIDEPNLAGLPLITKDHDHLYIHISITPTDGCPSIFFIILRFIILRYQGYNSRTTESTHQIKDDLLGEELRPLII